MDSSKREKLKMSKGQRLGKVIQMEEERKPIETTCPNCGKLTTILCRENFVCRRVGVVYDIDSIDIEVLYESHPAHDWEFSCRTCSYIFDNEELEEIAYSDIPITEQLKMESGIDLFEDFWEKNQSQSKKGEEE